MVTTWVRVLQQMLIFGWRFKTQPMNPIIARRSRRVVAYATRQAHLATIQRHLVAAKWQRTIALLSLIQSGIVAANARVIIEWAFPNGTATQPFGPGW